MPALPYTHHPHPPNSPPPHCHDRSPPPHAPPRPPPPPPPPDRPDNLTQSQGSTTKSSIPPPGGVARARPPGLGRGTPTHTRPRQNLSPHRHCEARSPSRSLTPTRSP